MIRQMSKVHPTTNTATSEQAQSTATQTSLPPWVYAVMGAGGAVILMLAALLVVVHAAIRSAKRGSANHQSRTS